MKTKNITIWLTTIIFFYVWLFAEEQENLKMASWNIRILSQKRDVGGIQKIVRIIQKYDFITMLEVRDKVVVETICEMLKEGGKKYDYQLSPPVGKAVKERYCFLYDKNKVRVLVPGKVYPDHEGKFIRPPFYATFVCGQFDFTTIATHIIWGNTVRDRRKEITQLAKVFDDIQNEDPKENDVILMGDFNRPPEDDLAFGALKAIPHIVHLFASPEKSMVGDTNLYDNIWLPKNYVREWTGKKGIDRFDETLFQNDSTLASLLVSDHRPVWAIFSTAGPDDD